MARDYLAIPSTSVPIKRVFSGGADLISKKMQFVSGINLGMHVPEIMVEKRIVERRLM